MCGRLFIFVILIAENFPYRKISWKVKQRGYFFRHGTNNQEIILGLSLLLVFDSSSSALLKN